MVAWELKIREVLQRLSDDLFRVHGIGIDFFSAYHDLSRHNPKLPQVVDDWLNGVHAATTSYGALMVEYAATVVAYRLYVTSLGDFGDKAATWLIDRIDNLIVKLTSQEIDVHGLVLTNFNTSVTELTSPSAKTGQARASR